MSNRNIQVLFIHGMGRGRLSGFPLLLHLKRQGFTVSTFGYSTALEEFAGITARLRRRIEDMAARGPYALVGHSLGGIMIREALAQLGSNTRQPLHVFLLGSPVRPARLARHFQRSPVFRALTRDCGRLLASDERMRALPFPEVPITIIVGTGGPRGRLSPFGNLANDGIISVEEARPEQAVEEVRVKKLHTLLPSSLEVARLVSSRLTKDSDKTAN